KQIPKAAFSYINTIDGFCAEIYRRYFEDIGGEPSISVLEERDAELLFKLAMNEVLDEYLSSGEEEFYQLADMFTERRKLDKLKETIIAIHNFVRVQAKPQEFFANANKTNLLPIEDAPATKYYLQYIRKKVNAYCVSGDKILGSFYAFGKEAEPLDKFRDEVQIWRTLAEKLSLTDSLESLINVLVVAEKRRAPSKTSKLPSDGALMSLQEDAAEYITNTKKYIGELKEELLPSPDDVKGSLEILRERETASKGAIAKLIEVAQKVREKYADFKLKEGVADFSDLGHFALKILSNPSRAAEVAEGIEFVFLDEYQDTNYLQEEIIAKITKDNIFMVGDVKQSIYKFRFAEPKIFLDKSERFKRGSGGSGVNLTKNFRSSKEILKFVNLVFSEIMTHSFGGVDYRKDAAFDLDSVVKSDPNLPAVRTAFFATEKRETPTPPPLYSVKEGALYTESSSKEALYIAGRIEQIVGKIKIFVGDEKKERLADYGDIAIIMRNKRGEAIRAELKKRGIPFIAPEFGGTEEYDDIELLVCLLRIIDNLRNDIPLFSVMRSFFGGFGEAELAEIRGNNKDGFFWNAVESYDIKTELKAKISAFTAMLHRYRLLSRSIDAAELISLIIAETGYDGYLLSRDESERMEYVNAFIHTLRGTGATVRECLASYDALGAPEINISSSAYNAVRFYSIHQSKGLEFPIVFFAGIQQGLNIKKAGERNIILNKDFGIALKWQDTENKTRGDTLSSRGFRIKEEIEEKEELMRLMYVAMTRGRFHLFMTGEKSGTAKYPPAAEDGKGFIDWLEFAAAKNPEVAAYKENQSFDYEFVASKKELPLLHKAEPLDLALNYPEREALGISAKYTVSELNRAETAESEYGYVPFLDDKAAEKGTAYHAFMEFADFNITDPEGIEGEIGRLKEAGLLDGSEHLDPQILSNALKNPLFDKARQGNIIKEKPFILYLPANEVLDTTATEKTLIQGVIDLIITGEENILVDYKFTLASPESIREKYRAQIDLYGKAAQLLMNIKLDKKVIFIINKSIVIEI
ncbi:MAG: UvrD-helicase domain-containing protein, partial [Clostridia bacterium]